jgi:hypothetical protein
MGCSHHVVHDREMRQRPDEGHLTGELTYRITTLEALTQDGDGGDPGQRQNNAPSVLLTDQIQRSLKENKPVRCQVFSPHTVSQFPDALLLNDGIDQSGKETGADGALSASSCQTRQDEISSLSVSVFTKRRSVSGNTC